MNSLLKLSAAASLFLGASCVTTPPTSQRPDYFGQQEPGLDPLPFSYAALGLAKTAPRIPAFSRDGRFVLFNMGAESQIYIATKLGGTWTKPVRAPFSNEGQNWEPFLLPDQRTVLFGSTRSPGSAPHKPRAWMARHKRGGGWTEPALAITTDQETGIWYPTGPNLRSVHFSATLPSGLGRDDIWTADLATKSAFVNLPAPINSDAIEWDPYVLPSGDGLLFASTRAGGHGRADLYVAFRTAAGGWGEPRNLGPKINTAGNEVASAISPDGRFLFFIREPNQLFWVSTQLLELK